MMRSTRKAIPSTKRPTFKRIRAAPNAQTDFARDSREETYANVESNHSFLDINSPTEL